jgi:predicted O-methyltransferase YrrM
VTENINFLDGESRLILSRFLAGYDTSDCLIPLIQLAREVDAKTLVEIGVREGISTVALLLACKALGGHLWSVDIEPCLKARETVKNLGLEHYWTFTQAHSLEFVKTWNKTIDLLFIDSGHTFDLTINELRAYSKFLKVGGVIAMHDTLVTPEDRPEFGSDVWLAIQRFLRENRNYTFQELNTTWGLGVLQRLR